MNSPVELAALIFALAIMVTFFIKTGWSVLKSISVVLVAAPVLLFSITDIVSIATCDETYICFEPVDILNNSLFQWKLTAFRTTDLFIGIPMAVVSSTTGFTKDILVMIAKILHWFITLFIMILISTHLTRTIEKSDKYSTLFIFCLMSIFPVVLLALKVFNYDAFSMMLGCLAIILLLDQNLKSKARFIVSIVLLALASQEKLIASPLLWIAIFWAGFHYSLKEQKGRNVAVSAFIYSAGGTFLASGVFTLSFIIMSAVRKGTMPSYSPVSILAPMTNAFWPVLRSLKQTSSAEAGTWIDVLYLPLYITSMVILTGLFCSISGLVLHYIRSGIPGFRDFLHKNSSRACGTVMLVAVLLGIGSSLFIKAYLYPYFPIPAGHYIPTLLFNSAAVHFEAASGFEHILHFIGYAYAVFFSAIPTVWLLVVIFLSILKFYDKRAVDFSTEQIETTKHYTLILILLIPALYGIFQIPIGARYLNLFLLAFLLITASDFLRTIKVLSTKRKNFLYVIILVLIFAEVFPFRPIAASFRPWWLSYSESYMKNPSRGQLNPWGMGWGEEVSLAGRRLVDMYKEKGEDASQIRLYSNYMGDWFRRKPNIPIILTDTAKVFTYGEHDYYLLNRMGITQSQLPFPESVKPYMTLDFRGYVQAWVFRGSDIRGIFDSIPKTQLIR